MLRRLLLVSSIFLFSLPPIFATHIWGGELSYELLHYDTTLNQGYYKFSMQLYRVCKGAYFGCGIPQAIADFDTLIFVTVYDGNQNLIHNFEMPINSRDTLENPVYGSCLKAPPDVCVEKAVYEGNYWLDHIPDGYSVNYQRCCRTWELKNIVLPPCPGQPDVSSAWTLPIPTDVIADTNSSAQFANEPPTILCLNEPFLYDHGALDPDGDSLVYEFCDELTFNTGMVWGGGIAGAAPNPSMYPALFFTVPYAAGYSNSYPLDAYPTDSFRIDSETGIMTGTPNQAGFYVLAVCVSEYRNGVFLSTSRRDYNMDVRTCIAIPAPELSSDTTGQCINNTITFQYSGTESIMNYYWDFGDGQFSVDSNPTHLYSAGGTYDISLAVEYPSGCSDTIIEPGYIFIDSCNWTNIESTNLSQYGIKVHPNPTSGIFEIQLENDLNLTIDRISVYQTDGRRVADIANSLSFDLSYLSNGMYFLKISTDQGQFTERIIIQ